MCEVYDHDEEPFIGACMWQMEMETVKEMTGDGPMNWTPGLTAPKYPTFSLCGNEE